MKNIHSQFLYVVFRINHFFLHKLGVYETLSGAKNRVKKDKLKNDPYNSVIYVIYKYEYQKIIQVN